ncbi:MAG: 16S rRNA (cytidine(1402)-2'-O)-methyltransferase [Hyphomicrobiales bacterium]|nr:16S rRNA (cytidine(1402)-2'-O)-methyltransferase [Hyphomicrobiales bacterium]
MAISAQSRRTLNQKSTRATPKSKREYSRHGAAEPGGALYVVATPIGNAADITLRARDILADVDVIACEDTRVTARLLAIHGISRPLRPYHDHNAPAAGPALIERMRQGERVALVSDAGTPLVSDPGYRLVRGCIDNGVPVIPIPGASSILAALAVSGLPTDRFFFAGFLPVKAGARRTAIASLAAIPSTLVIMEAPHRLIPALTDLAASLGPREAAVTRELTKQFEEIRRGTLVALLQHYREAGPPKGEVTLVIGGPQDTAPDLADFDARLREALASMSVSEAAAHVAKLSGLPRRAVYERALQLTNGKGKTGPKGETR